MESLKQATHRLWGWVGRAARVVGGDPVLWACVSAVYLLVGFLLNLLPYIGFLLFVWLSPLFISGAIALAWAIREGSETAGVGTGTLYARVKDSVGRATGALFSVFWAPDKTLAAVIVGTLALGGMVLVQILGELLQIGGVSVPAMLMGGVGIAIWGPALVSVLLVWLLKTTLVLTVLYATPLVVIEDERSLSAIEQAFRAIAANPVVELLLGALFLIPLALAAHFGTLLAFAVAWLVLPLFLHTVLESRADLFP